MRSDVERGVRDDPEAARRRPGTKAIRHAPRREVECSRLSWVEEPVPSRSMRSIVISQEDNCDLTAEMIAIAQER
jgi:hypothetical protein